MLISLLEIIKTTSQLPQIKEIHFPTTGYDFLSKIEEKHFWFSERRHVIRKLLHRNGINADAKNTVGIDVGCGTGFNAVWLTEKGLSTLGLDAAASFSYYQKEKRGFGFLAGDIMQIDPKPEFDYVLLLDVLEHIEDDEKFIAKVIQLLKPNGLIVISVPAFESLSSEIDKRIGHFRRYSKNDLLNKVMQASEGKLALKDSFYFCASTLPLYILSRKFIQKFGENKMNEMEMPSKIPNLILKALLRMESTLLFPYGAPMGSSLYMTFKMCP